MKHNQKVQSQFKNLNKNCHEKSTGHSHCDNETDNGHYVATKIELQMDGARLNNATPRYFGTMHLEDGLETARDFKIQIVPTY